MAQLNNSQHLEAFWIEQTKNPGSPSALACFRAVILDYYLANKRSFAWRENITPYHVTVSEIMLQQTQTYRVAGKFEAFIAAFPDFASLAAATTSEVIRLWKGLGYNRRALALQKIAQLVTTEHDGILPDKIATLETFPSIGKATARSIITYAYNRPTTFIETNVRAVFIYFFFAGKTMITDAMLDPLVAAAVDQANPREWYYALMDYGVMLKKTVGNTSRMSAHHAKQSRFEGSDRQVRGMILQALLDQPGIVPDDLPAILGKKPERVATILKTLCKEGFIISRGNKIYLP
jgi:A/G-specific adenine glycosylase